jgi:uncharacterized membrane protein YheB (UPF0754 family)
MDAKRITKWLFKGYERTLATLVTYILSVIDKELAGQPSVQRAREMVASSLTTLEKAIHRIRKSEFTDRVAAADVYRDQLQRAVIERVSSDKRCTYNQKTVDNAEKLDQAIEQGGRALKPGYFDQAEQLKSLLGKFAEPSLAAAIDENGMRDLVDNLALAHQSFMEIWDQANQSDVDKEDIPSLRNAASDAINAVNGRLLKRLEIEAIDEGAPFTTAIERINKAVEKVETIQRARITQNDTSDEPVNPGE